MSFKQYLNEIKSNHGDYEIFIHTKYGRDGNSEVRDGYMVYHKDQAHPLEHFYRKSDAVIYIKNRIEQDKLKEKK